MALAYFSPMPPSTSGIAAYSSELLPLLRERGYTVDVFTEQNAHEFVWTHRRRPYDLTIYQLGNASCHDYMWAYLFRYPGMVVLHDLQLHQARALYLTRRWQPRVDDYMAEMRANHPEAPADLPYLVLARMADRMYQHWPMIRLVLERAKLTLVHNHWAAGELKQRYPAAHLRAITMGVAAPRPPAVDVRHRHQLAGDAFIVSAIGGVTPEKRIPQLIRALSAMAERHPHFQLMLVGAPAAHYDVLADARTHGVEDRVHLTGFVPDDELPAYLAASDVCACLRWPTNRETSASWLRCIAAARPTLVTELMHLNDIPTLDPRGWRLLNTENAPRDPIAVSIDVLDEDQCLQLALERLAVDAGLRRRIGDAAHRWWATHHQLPSMADDYEAAISTAIAAPVPSPDLPAHLLADGTRQLRELAASLGLTRNVTELL